MIWAFCCSVTHSCPTLWDLLDCNTLGSPVSHYLPEFLLRFMSVESVRLSAASCSFCLQSLTASGSFQMSWFFASGGQSIGASASASVLLMNIQCWFPFRMDWFDLLAVQGTLKSLLQHHSSKASVLWCSAFSRAQLYIHTRLLEKPQLWLYRPLSANW